MVGIDGMPGGWIAVRLAGGSFAAVSVEQHLADLIGRHPGALAVGADIPIGLATATGGPCDELARRPSGVRNKPARTPVRRRHRLSVAVTSFRPSDSRSITLRGTSCVCPAGRTTPPPPVMPTSASERLARCDPGPALWSRWRCSSPRHAPRRPRATHTDESHRERGTRHPGAHATPEPTPATAELTVMDILLAPPSPVGRHEDCASAGRFSTARWRLA